MPDVQTRTHDGVIMFPEELVPELIQLTRGNSALAKLCGSTPIPFNGMKEFTFSLDREVDVVAEGGAMGKGGVTVKPRTIIPIKVEYGARISAEFDTATKEEKLNYLKAFSDGFAKKLAKGIDLMAFHGINPRSGQASDVIGNNCFAKMVTNAVTITADSKPDADIESAIEKVQDKQMEVTGLVLAPAFKSALAKQTKADGCRLYPELAWGNNPGNINGLRTESTSNLSANSSLDRALLGDFANFFKWGYSKNISIEIIRYGNPDNDSTLGDLKGHDQIYLRGIAYVGWGILSADAFAYVKDTAAG